MMIETTYMSRVNIWLKNTILFIFVNVVLMFKSSEIINALNVIVTILEKDFSNIQKVKSIITAPWYILFHIQIKNVLRLSYLPFCKLW